MISFEVLIVHHLLLLFLILVCEIVEIVLVMNDEIVLVMNDEMMIMMNDEMVLMKNDEIV